MSPVTCLMFEPRIFYAFPSASKLATKLNFLVKEISLARHVSHFSSLSSTIISKRSHSVLV